jgi:hypothetical protein
MNFAAYAGAMDPETSVYTALALLGLILIHLCRRMRV